MRPRSSGAGPTDPIHPGRGLAPVVTGRGPFLLRSPPLNSRYPPNSRYPVNSRRFTKP